MRFPGGPRPQQLGTATRVMVANSGLEGWDREREGCAVSQNDFTPCPWATLAAL